jgi:transcription initiation factor IIE alpha subunit
LIGFYRRRTVAVEMTDFEQGVWDYLCSHKKTPVQAKTIAKEWIVSENRVARTLNRFYENNIVDIVRIGSKKFYKIKE